jgi:hypothetical protein
LGGPAQEFPEFILPDPDLGSEALLMAELVDAKVTFVNPTAIGAVNDLKFGLPGENLANVANVVVTPDSVAGGTKRSSVEEVPQSAASLIVAAAPGQPLTIGWLPERASKWPISAVTTTLVATGPAAVRDFRRLQLSAVRCWLV